MKRSNTPHIIMLGKEEAPKEDRVERDPTCTHHARAKEKMLERLSKMS